MKRHARACDARSCSLKISFASAQVCTFGPRHGHFAPHKFLTNPLLACVASTDSKTMSKTSTAQLSLSNILDKPDEEAESLAQDALPGEKAEGWDEEDVNIAKEGYCIECEGASTIHDFMADELMSL